MRVHECYSGEAGRRANIGAIVARTMPQLHQHHAEARRVNRQLPGTAPRRPRFATVETYRPTPEPMSR
jgi:hypothetical protein